MPKTMEQLQAYYASVGSEALMDLLPVAKGKGRSACATPFRCIGGFLRYLCGKGAKLTRPGGHTQ